MSAENARLQRELEKIDSEIRKIDGKLANKQFVAKAPAHVVAEQHERRVDFEATLERLNAALKRLEAIA
jgi:valyl-tRNA synthetase